MKSRPRTKLFKICEYKPFGCIYRVKLNLDEIFLRRKILTQNMLSKVVKSIFMRYVSVKTPKNTKTNYSFISDNNSTLIFIFFPQIYANADAFWAVDPLIQGSVENLVFSFKPKLAQYSIAQCLLIEFNCFYTQESFFPVTKKEEDTRWYDNSMTIQKKNLYHIQLCRGLYGELPFEI